MQNVRLLAVGFFVAVLFSAGLAQNVAQHLLGSDELKKVVPTEFFFAGQKAPTQLRNAAGSNSPSAKNWGIAMANFTARMLARRRACPETA